MNHDRRPLTIDGKSEEEFSFSFWEKKMRREILVEGGIDDVWI